MSGSVSLRSAAVGRALRATFAACVPAALLVSADFRRDALAWKWEVNVVSSSELNAFCMPGGKIVFYSGLITGLHLNDDEIEVVMGHEISHAAYEALIATKFSRVDEADRIGLELTARAGYDPRAGVALWQKIAKAHQGGQQPEFFSTHPADASRVQQIQSLLPIVMPPCEAARRK